jgi:hypothetical protein
MFEEIISFLQIPAVGSALILFGRNIYGWINRSLEDGKLDSYEWKQLAKTMLQLGGFTVFAYLGINTLFPGLVSEVDATVLIAFADVIRSYFKKTEKSF